LLRLSAALLCALVLTGAGTCAWAEFRLDRSVDLGGVADRRPPGKGTNYLIVGSDGRDGLSEQARKELHTGTAGGSRTDSMMLLHTGAHGTTMVSLPRDSWVTIPSYVDPNTGKFHRAAKNKLNAAYSLGGPPSGPSSSTRACASTTTPRSASRGLSGSWTRSVVWTCACPGTSTTRSRD
jgi:anionic cell wall polymer biosynthesis LytR-Cps2A-Psr (LCP) family protein